MKTKLLLTVVLATSLLASAAVAAPPPGAGKPQTVPPTGKGKPPTTGVNCKPKVTVVLKGSITGTGATLTMTVTRGNRWGRAWVTAGTASVTVDTSTKVRRNGKKTADDLMVTDWVLVQARVCKADLANDAMPPLTAARVVAHPTKA